MSENSKFTFLTLKEAVTKLDSLAPLQLAEDWDNVGLLLEPSQNLIVKNVLLTIDLTEAVVKEAIAKQINLIIAYHPPIFRAFRRLTYDSWKERVILNCAKNKIAIYSPHTALDAMKGGINDWLISCFQISSSNPINQSYEKGELTFSIDVTLDVDQSEIFEALIKLPIELKKRKESEENYHLNIICNQSMLLKILTILSKSETSPKIKITKLEMPPVLDHGMGRICYLKNPLSISDVVEIVKRHLNLSHVRLALGCDHSKDTEVSCIATCAGSGVLVLKNVKAELIITGEMSHHEILDLVHCGSSLILCEHSNTERGYLNLWIQTLKSIFSKKKVNLFISEFDQDSMKVV